MRIANPAFPAGLEDAFGPDRTDARHPQELPAVRPVDIDGEKFRVPFRPDQLGVFRQGQIPLFIEKNVFAAEMIFPQEEIHLIEAMFADEGAAGFRTGGGKRQIGKERLLLGRRGSGVEVLVGGEVHPLHIEFLIQPVGGPHDVAVSFPGGTHDELGGLFAGPLDLLPQPVDGVDGRNDVLVKPFSLGKFGQVRRGGGLDIDGNPCGQADGLLYGCRAGAGDNLQVDKSPEPVMPAEDFHGGQKPAHGRVGAAANAGGEKQAADQVGLQQLHEGFRQVFRGYGAPGLVLTAVERAVATVVDAGIAL